MSEPLKGPEGVQGEAGMVVSAAARKKIAQELEVLRTQCWAIQDGQQAFQFMNRCQGFLKNYAMPLINLLKDYDDGKTENGGDK